MEGVKRGGDRQELHEVIRSCSMEATARMKNGQPCALLEALADRPEFNLTKEEMEAVLEPSLYIGRCPDQVDKFLAEVRPLISDIDKTNPEINV